MHTDFFYLYPINPKSLARYREAFYPSGAKDDPEDADLLREMVEKNQDRFRCWKPEDPLTRQLQLAVEYRRKLVTHRTALTNQLTSLLKSYFPQALEWAGALDTAQACDFFQRWPNWQSSKPRLLAKSGNSIEPTTAETCAPRRTDRSNSSRSAVDRGSGIIGAMSLMVRSLAQQLQPLLSSIAEFDRLIQTLFQQHPDYSLFDSFPGAGAALAPRLLAALGTDRQRFETAAHIKRFSGIAPITRKSGHTQVVLAAWPVLNFYVKVFMSGQA